MQTLSQSRSKRSPAKRLEPWIFEAALQCLIADLEDYCSTHFTASLHSSIRQPEWQERREGWLREKRQLASLSFVNKFAAQAIEQAIFRDVVLESRDRLIRFSVLLSQSPFLTFCIRRLIVIQLHQDRYSFHLISYKLMRLLPQLSTLHYYSFSEEHAVTSQVTGPLFFWNGVHTNMKELVLVGHRLHTLSGLFDILRRLPSTLKHLRCLDISWDTQSDPQDPWGHPIQSLVPINVPIMSILVQNCSRYGAMAWLVLPQVRRPCSWPQGGPSPVVVHDIANIARLVEYLVETGSIQDRVDSFDEEDAQQRGVGHASYIWREADDKWCLDVFAGFSDTADNSRVVFKFGTTIMESCVEEVELTLLWDWTSDAFPDSAYDGKTLCELLGKFDNLRTVIVNVECDEEVAESRAEAVRDIQDHLDYLRWRHVVVLRRGRSPAEEQPLFRKAHAVLKTDQHRETLPEDMLVRLLEGALSGITQDEKSLMALRGVLVEKALYKLQEMLDHQRSTINSQQLFDCCRLLRRLSVHANVIPSFLFLYGVSCTGFDRRDPAAIGGNADIYKGSSEGNRVALKRLRFAISDRNYRDYLIQLCTEALVWRQLKHKHIQPFLGIDLITFEGRACLVSPWVQHGNINKFIGELTSQGKQVPLIQWLRETSDGLAYLHAQTITHGDLRGPNILIDDCNHVLLTDFGLVSFANAFTESASTRSRMSNYRWCAPEFGDDNEIRTSPIDIYSFACTCVEVYNKGRPPFHEFNNDMGVMRALMANKRPSRPTAITMPDFLWTLVQECWNGDPEKRPTAKAIVQRLYVDEHAVP